MWAEVDLQDVSPDELTRLRADFELDPLALDDARNTRQRTKAESYDTHEFAVVHQLDPVNGRIESRQISCFFGDNYMLLVHDNARRTIDEVTRRLQSLENAAMGGSYLIYTVLDTLVDDYERTANAIQNQLDDLEEILVTDEDEEVERDDPELQKRVYDVTQRLVRFRRYALPINLVVQHLNDPTAQRAKGRSRRMERLLRDVYDHAVRLGEQIHAMDELAEAAMELTRSAQAARLNEVTKRLTGWGAIIAVPTFIASVYGMNFELVPDEGQLLGFWFALILMALSSVALYVYFRKRRWL